MIVGLIQPIIGTIGGIDQVFDVIIKILKEHEIIVFTSSNVNKPYPSNITFVTKLPIFFPFLGIYQKFLISKFDFSRCNIVISLTGINVKTNKPLIIYDQNNLAQELNQKIPLKYQKGFWKYYYKLYLYLNRNDTLNNKAIYICNSKYSANQLKSIGSNDPIVIYPPVNLDEFYNDTKKKQVCVVGRISPEKNLEQTIKILNNVNYPCIIFGNVTRTTQPYFQKLKKKSNDNIIFMINRPRYELIKLMAESMIIFTSSEETFGITTIEGIASGCIPIVPDNSAHKETVPIIELRYSNMIEAQRIINQVMISTNCFNLNYLKEHIKQYSFDNFKNNLLKVIDTYESS